MDEYTEAMDTTETTEIVDSEEESSGAAGIAIGAGLLLAGAAIYKAASAFVPKGVSWLNHKLNKQEYEDQAVEEAVTEEAPKASDKK